MAATGQSAPIVGQARVIRGGIQEELQPTDSFRTDSCPIDAPNSSIVVPVGLARPANGSVLFPTASAVEGELGPVGRHLAALGPIHGRQGVVADPFAEGWQHMEALLTGAAHSGSLVNGNISTPAVTSIGYPTSAASRPTNTVSPKASSLAHGATYVRSPGVVYRNIPVAPSKSQSMLTKSRSMLTCDSMLSQAPAKFKSPRRQWRCEIPKSSAAVVSESLADAVDSVFEKVFGEGLGEDFA